MKFFYISNQFIFTVLIGWGFALSGYAGTWQPICPEHGACSNAPAGSLVIGPPSYHAMPGSAPLVTRTGDMWFDYLETGFQEKSVRLRLPNLTPDTFEQAFFTGGFPGSPRATDLNSIQTENGEILVFFPAYVSRYLTNGTYIETIGLWNNQPLSAPDPDFIVTFSSSLLLNPPTRVNNTIYIGIGFPASLAFYFSTDNGKSWHSVESQLQEVSANQKFAYKLATNVSADELWLIARSKPLLDTPPFGFAESSLWRTQNHGETWSRVDDGSFPPRAEQIVSNVSAGPELYALTTEGSTEGLYVSESNGRSWVPTALKTAVYSLEIIPRANKTALLIAGVAQGVMLSTDRGKSWQAMSAGLLAIPHSIKYAKGIIIASSAAGYFACPGLDCMGNTLPLTEPIVNGQRTNPFTSPAPRTVPAIEFYNRTLDHYFLTTDAAEAVGIDEGKAGPGWERSGHRFKVWPKLGVSTSGAHVCRFYGSVNPGPNSHFFSISPAECSQLLKRQDSTPADKPRWHLEDYAFMAVPPRADNTCPDQYQPVYRAYNNGFSQGKDSNHRFVTDQALLEPLFAKGWIDEGIGFCVPE